jgi:hypothetical protein
MDAATARRPRRPNASAPMSGYIDLTCARVDAALEEQACVEADGGDGEEDGQVQPPALRQRVGDGPQPDPCMRPDTYGAANELVMQIAEQRSWNEALIYNQWFYTIEF